jgi:hypothetical protein
MKLFLSSIVIAVISFFSYSYWANSSSLEQVKFVISLDMPKPWVYRQLVPLLARGLTELGLTPNISLLLVVILSGVGFYLAFYELLKFLGYKSELKALIGVLLGMVLFGWECMSYDLMTALSWTLALLFIVKQNHIAYMVLFPFVCLNRIETAPFMIFMYWLRFPGRWQYVLYQGIAFILIYYGLHIYFADNSGLSQWIEPLENLKKFWDSPWRTAVHFLISTIILFRIAMRADYQPLYFQRVFIVLTPIFLVLYLVFGQSFEVRVFFEIWPILATLMLI